MWHPHGCHLFMTSKLGCISVIEIERKRVRVGTSYLPGGNWSPDITTFLPPIYGVTIIWKKILALTPLTLISALSLFLAHFPWLCIRIYGLYILRFILSFPLFFLLILFPFSPLSPPLFLAPALLFYNSLHHPFLCSKIISSSFSSLSLSWIGRPQIGRAPFSIFLFFPEYVQYHITLSSTTKPFRIYTGIEMGGSHGYSLLNYPLDEADKSVGRYDLSSMLLVI